MAETRNGSIVFLFVLVWGHVWRCGEVKQEYSASVTNISDGFGGEEVEFLQNSATQALYLL
jgi:hypothetical protein